MRKSILQKCVRTGWFLLLFLAIALSTALSGGIITAHNSAPAATLSNGAFGEVISINTSQTSFTIQTTNQGQLTINTNQSTTFLKISISSNTVTGITDTLEALMGESSLSSSESILNLFGASGTEVQPAGFKDIKVGDIISVNGSSSNNLASEIFIIKFTDLTHVRGQVTAVGSNSLTITPVTGGAVTVTWNSNTRFILHGMASTQSGASANALYNKSSRQAAIIIIK